MSSPGSTRPTRIHTVLPALRGRGVLLAAPQDASRIRQELSAAGFAVAEADLTDGGDRHAAAEVAADTLDTDPVRSSLRTAQAAVATALHLPETAGRNLDALVDSLRDLATWWPENERIVLLVHGAESLVESDLPGWHILTEILREASADLWRGGVEGDRAFETVAFVHRHGVPALPGPGTPADRATGGWAE